MVKFDRAQRRADFVRVRAHAKLMATARRLFTDKVGRVAQMCRCDWCAMRYPTSPQVLRFLCEEVLTNEHDG